MTATKTHAYILKVLPFRESSAIVYLFTESTGLIHGVARGIRSRKRGASTLLERGLLVETFVYFRPNRELHTLGNISVLEAFPETRASLLRTAVRDIAFEVALSGIKVSDPHPELFGFFAKFLHYLESCTESQAYPFALWRFLHRFPALLGFALGLERCIVCGDILPSGGELDIAAGGLQCASCGVKDKTNRFVSSVVIDTLTGRKREITEIQEQNIGRDLRRITRLLTHFCRYHFEIRNDYRSLAFLEEIVE
ncbi:MAG: DNA repair protein RecO [Chitinivibrionales bacterium]|nr:DNA repair protein RecO [Chitinivibrionales bacterium]MBD3357259.1 DNA repair protein RecO [Chitinivibrionales bacterium]